MKIKRIIGIILFTLLCTCVISGCSNNSENTVSSIQDVQGYWYDEDSNMIMGFKENLYILHGFVTQISITGTFEVDDQTIIVHTNVGVDKIYNAKIENGILLLKTQDGQITRWKNISEDEAERLTEKYDK